MNTIRIICDNREAIINGSSVQISRLRMRNKKKPLRISAWPETDMLDPIKAWNVALQWIKNGFIDEVMTGR